MRMVRSKLILFVILAASSWTLVSYSSKANVPPTLNGDWELIENPEISDDSTGEKVFYTFSETGKYGDGTYKTIYDGGIETGDYKLSEKDGKEYINMGTGELEYILSDSELTVIYPADSEKQDDEKYIFARATAPDYENKSYDSFEIDKDLISEWITEERTLSYYATEIPYTEILEFKENGIMVINYVSADLLLDRDMYYAYTAKNHTLTFSSVTNKETKYSISYDFDKDGNLKFDNDETASSIFSDAFFSDVTYGKK